MALLAIATAAEAEPPDPLVDEDPPTIIVITSTRVVLVSSAVIVVLQCCDMHMQHATQLERGGLINPKSPNEESVSCED